MDESPHWPFGNSQSARAIRIEASLPIVFDKRITHRWSRPVLDREWHDRVVRPLELLAGIELTHLDGKRQTVDAELLGAFQVARRPFRTPEPQWIRSSLERHRAHQSDDADDVVSVEVRKENVAQRERHAVAHHLSLRYFTAVEQHRLSLAHQSDRGDVALHRRAGRGRAEEDYGERHLAAEYRAPGWEPREVDRGASNACCPSTKPAAAGLTR